MQVDFTSKPALRIPQTTQTRSGRDAHQVHKSLQKNRFFAGYNHKSLPKLAGGHYSKCRDERLDRNLATFARPDFGDQATDCETAFTRTRGLSHGVTTLSGLLENLEDGGETVLALQVDFHRRGD